MIFKDKLDALLTSMNITNIDLAKSASLDSSLISRFRTGARVPSKNSNQIGKLSKGLVSFAKNQEQRVVLLKTAKLPVDKKLDEIESSLCSWFNGEDSMLKPQRNYSMNIPSIKKIKRKKTPLKSFKEKLDILMKSMKISNVQLAKALNVDNSLISRFRTGVRTPSHESQMIENICNYFSTRASTPKQITTLLETMGLTIDHKLDNSLLLSEYLYEWLSERQDTMNNTAMDNFLFKLDMFQSTKELPPCTIISEPLQDCDSLKIQSYWGIDGIRQTVINFLSAIAAEDTPRTIYLYSDQNMEWLTSAQDFTNIWASLMFKVISNGNKIRIIHTISRDLSEIFVAIESWLPIYMTGQIEPYYCKYPKDTLFNRTIFIAPGLSYITSNCVAGTESSAEYICCTEPNRIAYMMEQFETMISYSKCLMEIFTLRTIDNFLLRVSEFERQTGATKTLSSSLSIATMPRDLFEQILNRTNLSSDKKEKALAYYKTKTNRFNKTITSSTFKELVVLPKCGDAFKGQMTIDFPKYIIGESLYYTQEEYSHHIKNIIRILKLHNNYHMYILPTTPLKNIQILVKKDVGTIIIKNDDPVTIFTFNHPLMCNAFINYLDILDDSHRKEKTQKDFVIEELLNLLF